MTQITSKLLSLVAIESINTRFLYFIYNLVYSEKPRAKSLIEYNINNFQEKAVDIEFPEQEADKIIMKMSPTLDSLMHKEKTRNTLLRKLS